MSTQVTGALPVMDLDQFRREVAGLVDPNRRATGAGETAEIKELASQLCLAMCELFGESLDRLTLWDRIGTALTTAAAKCDDGDLDRFASLCLEHVKGDPSAAARNESFVNFVETVAVRDDAWRQAFVRHCGGKSAIVLVHARRAWDDRKKTKSAGREGGVA